MPWRANNRGSLLHHPDNPPTPPRLITNGDHTVHYCMYTCHTFGPIHHHRARIIHAAESRTTGWCWFILSPSLCSCRPGYSTSKDSDPEHWIQLLTRCTKVVWRRNSFFWSPKLFSSGEMLLLLWLLHCNDYRYTYLALEVLKGRVWPNM